MAKSQRNEGPPAAPEAGNDWKTYEPQGSNLEPDRRNPWPVIQRATEVEHGAPVLWTPDPRALNWPAPWKKTNVAFHGEEEEGTGCAIQVFGSVIAARRRWIDRETKEAAPWNAYKPGMRSHVQIAVAFGSPEQMGILTGAGAVGRSLWAGIDRLREKCIDPAFAATRKSWPTYAWRMGIGIGDEVEESGEYGTYRYRPFAFDVYPPDQAFVGNARAESYRVLYETRGKTWVREWDSFDRVETRDGVQVPF